MLEEDPGKAPTLPGITLRTLLHFQACDQKLLSFEEFPSFNPVSQETPPDQRLDQLLIASFNIKLRLLWTRHVAPQIPEQMSYNAIKHSLMTYVAKEEFRDNAAAFYRNYQQAIGVRPANLRVAWHYLPMAFGPQLTSYDVRKAAYECFLPDLRQEMYQLHESQLRANNYPELLTLLDWAEAAHESLKARRIIVSLETTPSTTPLVALVSNNSEQSLFSPAPFRNGPNDYFPYRPGLLPPPGPLRPHETRPLSPGLLDLQSLLHNERIRPNYFHEPDPLGVFLVTKAMDGDVVYKPIDTHESNADYPLVTQEAVVFAVTKELACKPQPTTDQMMAEFLVWLQKLLECATREAPAWKDTIQTVVHNRGQAARTEFAGKCWNCNATGHPLLPGQ